MDTKPVIDPIRLAKVTHLYRGSHNPGDDKMCVMEAVAFVTHKKWTAQPPCVCPVLGAFMRAWNDGLLDDERTSLLLPFIPRLLNTKGSTELEQRRAMMAADWLIRTHTVAWLRLAKLDEQADALASLPEITDFAQCPSLIPTLRTVKAAARAAAKEATWDAEDATWDAEDAAWDAAWAAAWAWAVARAAAKDATWDAGWAVARAAAKDASRDALAETKQSLQQSAIALVERMIELGSYAGNGKYYPTEPNQD